MVCAEPTVCGGLRARLFRISFSGQLAYELAVPARYGNAPMARLIECGADQGATTYGTEAMGGLRIEKGHAAGNELNGQPRRRCRVWAGWSAPGKTRSARSSRGARVFWLKPACWSACDPWMRRARSSRGASLCRGRGPEYRDRSGLDHLGLFQPASGFGHRAWPSGTQRGPAGRGKHRREPVAGRNHAAARIQPAAHRPGRRTPA